MNPNNRATLEASRRLVEAGIVLETEAAWYQDDEGRWWLLPNKEYNKVLHEQSLPAPCMAEAWRELPESIIDSRTAYFLKLMTVLGTTVAGYFSNGCSIKDFKSPNPTDALIALLIWPRGRKEAV